MKSRLHGNSELVSELVTVNGFKAAYAIKDGAEGTRGWIVRPIPYLLTSYSPYLVILVHSILRILKMKSDVAE